MGRIIMNNNQTEIKYGHIELEGNTIGYATYNINDTKVELLNLSNGLHVRIDGKIKYKPGDQGIYPYVIIWTKVAGWMGTADFARRYFS